MDSPVTMHMHMREHAYTTGERRLAMTAGSHVCVSPVLGAAEAHLLRGRVVHSALLAG